MTYQYMYHLHFTETNNKAWSHTVNKGQFHQNVNISMYHKYLIRYIFVFIKS